MNADYMVLQGSESNRQESDLTVNQFSLVSISNSSSETLGLWFRILNVKQVTEKGGSLNV